MPEGIGTTFTNTPKTRNKLPCDACKRSKTKCEETDDGADCNNCLQRGLRCSREQALLSLRAKEAGLVTEGSFRFYNGPEGSNSQHKYDRGQHINQNGLLSGFSTPLQPPHSSETQGYFNKSTGNIGQHCVRIEGGQAESYIHREGYMCYLGVRYFDNDGRVVHDEPHLMRVASSINEIISTTHASTSGGVDELLHSTHMASMQHTVGYSQGGVNPYDQLGIDTPPGHETAPQMPGWPGSQDCATRGRGV